MEKEKIYYYCPTCKRNVDFNETKGEIGGLNLRLFGPSSADNYPKPKRYHIKCSQQLIEVTKEKVKKFV